jgi:hypothetical protein
VNGDDTARLRGLLATQQSLLAYIRTALSFAGLWLRGRQVGLNPLDLGGDQGVGEWIYSRQLLCHVCT